MAAATATTVTDPTATVTIAVPPTIAVPTPAGMATLAACFITADALHAEPAA